jgi:hypothetical protein
MIMSLLSVFLRRNIILPAVIPIYPEDGIPSWLESTFGHESSGEYTSGIAEEDWLMMSQLPNGAITQSPGGDTVIPYFANAAARVLVDLNPDRAKSYMTWYLSNINLPDRWGFSGTVYDYRVRGSNLVSTLDYDSADSYASTFLSLVSYYFQQTSDREYIETNMTRLNKVASVLLDLQDKDGLVKVKPKSSTKYLMDNAENYRGLMDWADTLESLGRIQDALRYRRVALRVKEGIMNELYDPERRSYAWVMSWYGKRYPRSQVWYPDAVSQVSLISNQVINPVSDEASRIWAEFNHQFPRWDQGEKDDKFPWVMVALTAAGMNDTERVENFIAWVRAEYIENHRPYPWHIQESSNIVRIMNLLSPKVTPDEETEVETDSSIVASP